MLYEKSYFTSCLFLFFAISIRCLIWGPATWIKITTIKMIPFTASLIKEFIFNGLPYRKEKGKEVPLVQCCEYHKNSDCPRANVDDFSTAVTPAKQEDRIYTF